MKTRWRIVVASSAVLMAVGAPALAQEASTPPSPPARTDVVGPPQLQNFSLEGRVTREAPAPVPVQVRPRQTTAESASGQAAGESSARPSQSSRDTASARVRSEPPARNEPQRSASIDRPSVREPTRAIATPAIGESQEVAGLTPQPAFVPATADPVLDGSPGGVPTVPWLIAALALIGAAGWYFLRHRPRERYATAGGIDLFDATSPGQTPAPASPKRTPPPAAAPKPVSPGIVSTRLRPWLEIEFKPQRAIVDEQKAAIAFELSVFNSGSAPARDVLLEASMFNAGPMQDEQIRLFFENPVAKGDRIPVIAPLQRIMVNTAVFLQRDHIRPIEVEGRQLFVPLVAFNVLYGWGSAKGQTSASFLVGKTTKTDKLAPFRIDLGSRVFRSLDCRENDVRLRN